MSVPQRVAMYVKYIAPRYSGAGMQAVTLAHALQSRGVDTVAFTEATASHPDPYDLGGLPVIPFYPATDNTGVQPARVQALLRAMRALPRPTIFHAHSAYPEASLMGAGARLAGLPSLLKVTMHHSDADCRSSRLTGRLHRQLLRRQSGIVAISSDIQAELLSLGIPAERIVPIPNGVDLGRFGPASEAERAALRQRFRLPVDAPVAAFVGMLIPRKNVGWLVDEWLTWRRNRGPKAWLLLAGPADAAGAPDLAARIEALSLDPASGVRWVGQVDDVEAVYRAADLFVLPSHAEGLPNVGLEAMASGLPVAIAESSGAVDLLGAPPTGGIIFRPGDAVGLVAALDLLNADAASRTAVGSAARRRIQERFALGTIADRYVRLYGRLAAGLPAAG